MSVGGNLDRWDSKIESESIMSFLCSPEPTLSRAADRGVPASFLNDGEYGGGVLDPYSVVEQAGVISHCRRTNRIAEESRQNR